MSTTPLIKAITSEDFDKALAELANEQLNSNVVVELEELSGKTGMFLKFVEQYARPLNEVEGETAGPILVVIDEGQGMGPSELFGAILRSFSTRSRLVDLIEVLAPPEDVLSHEAVEQARRNAEARMRFLAEFPALTSGEVAELMGSRSNNRAALAHGWRKQGRVFSVQAGREQRYPLFQFDVEQGAPKPVIAEVVKELRDAGLEGWQIALWFTGRLARLDDHRPVDLLDENPKRVAEAARAVHEIPY